MKSKRRHELQTNELADQLGQWIENIKPYTTMILLVVVGAAAIIAAWYYLGSSTEKKQAQAWRSYLRAGTDPQGDLVAELSAVADDFSDTMAGLWAAQTAADIESARGIRLLFTDRASAETSLTLARSRYQEILDNKHAGTAPMLVQRAHFGLAQTYEAQNDVDEASKHYATVAESAKDTALGKAAQERIDKLAMADTKAWYNWFERQKPVPRDLGTGATSPLGSGLDLPPSDLNVVPDQPSDDFLKSGAAEDAGAATPPDEATKEDAAPKDPSAKPSATPEAKAEPQKVTEPAKDAVPPPDGTKADEKSSDPSGK